MEQWLRDALAEEQGYIICPLVLGNYIHCNEKCEECKYYKYYKEFEESFKENTQKLIENEKGDLK